MKGTTPKPTSAHHPRFTATKGSIVGFLKPEPYAHEPQHHYQAWCRKGQGDEVTLQYTGSFTNAVVERYVRVLVCNMEY